MRRSDPFQCGGIASFKDSAAIRFTIATAALLTGLAVFYTPAVAQTSASGIATQQPLDRIEWANPLRDSAARQSRAALLQAATVSSTNSAQFVIVVSQDGTIVEVRTGQSSGNPFMDHALRNSIMDMPRTAPFTDDMPRGSASFVLPVNVATP